jgi:hypothetical protein
LLYYRGKSEIEINNRIKEGKNIETNRRNRKKTKKIQKKQGMDPKDNGK